MLAGSLFDYDRFATFGFGQKTGFNKRTAGRTIKAGRAHDDHLEKALSCITGDLGPDCRRLGPR